MVYRGVADIDCLQHRFERLPATAVTNDDLTNLLPKFFASSPEIAKLVTSILEGGIDFLKYVETKMIIIFEGIPIAIIIDNITSCQISFFVSFFFRFFAESVMFKTDESHV